MTFKPGQSGNPKGRPKGSRHKLSESFLSAFCADFEDNGAAVIATVRSEDPSTYLKAAVSIIPKQIEKVENPLSGLSDDELEQLERHLESIRASGEDQERAEPANAGEPAALVSPVPEAG